MIKKISFTNKYSFCFLFLEIVICLSFELTRLASTNYDYRKHSWNFNTQWHTNIQSTMILKFDTENLKHVGTHQWKFLATLKVWKWVPPREFMDNWRIFIILVDIYYVVLLTIPQEGTAEYVFQAFRRTISKYSRIRSRVSICYLKFCPVRNQTSTSNY